MTELLKKLEGQWRSTGEYHDVKAVSWIPGQPREIKCPHGCNLVIYEPGQWGWGRIEQCDGWRQTRICRNDGYVRIYAITGPDAAACTWSPAQDESIM